MSVVHGFVVPGMPHPLLAPEQSPGWARLRAAWEEVRTAVEAIRPDRIVLYSTQWTSIIGHQVQTRPRPTWVHVDPEWHALGSIPYTLTIDPVLGNAIVDAARARGLHARGIDYDAFPVDTGTVVALTLLDPERRIPASVVSCNLYADRTETVVLGKATRDAIEASGQRTVAIAVTALSNRLFTRPIDPADDHLASQKDDEWNRKLLELFERGRLEDVAQLARSFAAEAQADQRLKAIWWLSALMGAHNRYRGRVFAYEAVWGTGAALIGLEPAEAESRIEGDLEFDEEDVEVFQGDRGVIDASAPETAPPEARPTPTATVMAADAPRPVGPYPHARRVGDLLYLSGVGPRQPGSDAIPGGPIHAPDGSPRDYDVRAQTRATLENVRRILEASGSRLEDVVDVTCFLVDMKRDFTAFNEVYREILGEVGPTRTTVQVGALPTLIAVELKVVARPVRP